MKSSMIAMTLGGALVLSAAAPLAAAESWSAMTMKPLMATSLEAGGAHVVSYFQRVNGACRLTMMMAGPSLENAKASAPARVQMTVEPGRSAQVDDADGKSSRFTCLASAQAMNVIRTDRVAAYPAAE